MATRDTYTKVHEEWKNRPDKSTAVFADDLEHIEQGIKDAADKRALKEIYDDDYISLGRKAGTQRGWPSATFGYNTIASGSSSCAGGTNTEVSGNYSRVDGVFTKAIGEAQCVSGKYNVPIKNLAVIVGGGTSESNRKNIHTLDWTGNGWFAGDVTNGNGVSLDGLMSMIGTTGQLRTIVDALPETNISTNTIYMVPKESAGDNDIYDEYINTDGTTEGWEFIGNSAVDLSDYYTQGQIDQILTGYVQAETGKGLSSNDYTDADLELVESIRNMTATDALAILNETEVES